MESIYTELALYGSKNECAKTDNVFSPISEVCDWTVSLITLRTRVALVFQSCVSKQRNCLAWYFKMFNKHAYGFH